MAKVTYALCASIQKYKEQGKTYREIAALTGLSKSTVAYEIKTIPHRIKCMMQKRADWHAQKKACSKNKNRQYKALRDCG